MNNKEPFQKLPPLKFEEFQSRTQDKKMEILSNNKKKGKQISKEDISKAKKQSDKIVLNELREETNCYELIDLYDRYKDLLYIEDTDRIDIVLATALSRKLGGIPIWMIIVGASGDMKSVQLNAIDNLNGVYYLHRITSKTLVNGYLNKKEHPDLAPKLKDKIVVIRDMAPLLKLPAVEKGEVWGQLRDLYDGFAGASSGQGLDAKYEGLKVTLLAGSTPAIDGQILVHQDLGTRELIYRTKGSDNKKKVMEKCLENEESEEDITGKLSKWTCEFLNNKEPQRNFIPAEILDELKEIAIYISFMRATADIDSYSNTLRTSVYPEEPTRIIKQLKRLYICLMSLSEDYPEWKAMRILWHVARSSAFQTRVKVLDFIINQTEELSTSKIAEKIRIGKPTVQRDLNILWNMGVVECRKAETSYPDKFYDYWIINREHKLIKNYKKKDDNNQKTPLNPYPNIVL